MSGLCVRSAALAGGSAAPLRAFKSLKGKSNASARWVRRQWSDPAVKQAKREGLRSRAAFKLRDLDSVAAEATAPKAAAKKAAGQERPRVVAVDLKHFDPVEGAAIVVGDFRQDAVRAQLDALLAGRKADVVLSDMAPSFSGMFLTDSQAQLRLCHNALKMAELYLRPGGHFATKILRCEGSEDFRAELKTAFEVVKAMKPQSSRPESTEMFLVAKGFRGATPASNSSADSSADSSVESAATAGGEKP
ncbi:hypothetical protein BBJ28_00024281 [Nothophytophthora sp. Chile5]|nr:hypothetical protein BBJ28_00024281 [Nothophytophthora sp. Chile5]